MKKTFRITVLALALFVATVLCMIFGIHERARVSAQTATEIETDVAAVAVLRTGSRGGEVSEVQRRLKMWGYYAGAVDGIFGSQTKNAVIYFQRKNGLTADGVVGLNTYKALGMTQSYNVLLKDYNVSGGTNSGGSSGSTGSTGGTYTPPSGYTSTDLYVLAKVIYAEGRGEPYVGQVAIGAVVLNRVKHSSFPNTISGVVYQKGAFTAVTDGQIKLEPDKTAYNAAQDAMKGWDPTYGCIYYYNPAVATSGWIFSRPVVTTIGRHVFAM